MGTHRAESIPRKKRQTSRLVVTTTRASPTSSFLPFPQIYIYVQYTNGTGCFPRFRRAYISFRVDPKVDAISSVYVLSGVAFSHLFLRRTNTSYQITVFCPLFGSCYANVLLFTDFTSIHRFRLPLTYLLPAGFSDPCSSSLLSFSSAQTAFHAACYTFQGIGIQLLVVAVE